MFSVFHFDGDTDSSYDDNDDDNESSYADDDDDDEFSNGPYEVCWGLRDKQKTNCPNDYLCLLEGLG